MEPASSIEHPGIDHGWGEEFRVQSAEFREGRKEGGHSLSAILPRSWSPNKELGGINRKMHKKLKKQRGAKVTNQHPASSIQKLTLAKSTKPAIHDAGRAHSNPERDARYALVSDQIIIIMGHLWCHRNCCPGQITIHNPNSNNEKAPLPYLVLSGVSIAWR